MTPAPTKPFKSILGPLHIYLIKPATPISPSIFKITTVRPFTIDKYRCSPNRPLQVCPAIPPPHHPTFLPTHTNMTNTASLLPSFHTEASQAPSSSSVTILTTQSASAYHPVLAQPSILSKDGSTPDLTEMLTVTSRIYMGVR